VNTPPRRDGADFAAWNEEMVRRYDIDRYYERSHPLVRWLEGRRITVLRSLAAPAAGDSVLEVGCGGGHVLERFAGCTRVGVDLSAAMLERARRRLGDEVRFFRAAAEDLPFAAASFDVVVCTEVLEHTRDPRRVVAELMRVAAPDGRVVVSIPNEANIDRAKRLIRATPIVRRLLRTLAAEGNEWHLHHFDRDQLFEVTRGTARIARLAGIPSSLLPVRYVALLRQPEHVSAQQRPQEVSP
jgi:2-polyprenyl-3-methyl-5-hydroxy-6-metoxy-1,4-benzoquinol methylase